MIVDIDDPYIKKCIAFYQETGDGFPKILEHLSLFIYNFPRMVTHNCKEDVFGEYYQYFLERFPKILLSYRAMDNVLFKTWFYLVQRRHYLNFLKSRKNSALLESTHEYMESLTIDTIGYSNEPASQLDVDKYVFSFVSEEDLLFLKLFSPENLTPKDADKLMENLGCDVEEFNKRVRLLFDSVETDRKKKIVRLVPINRVADFLGWNRLKVSKKLSKIRDRVQRTYIWEE